MSQLANCPRCNALFMKSSFQTVCVSCLKEEERAFETVYKISEKTGKPTVYNVSDRRKNRCRRRVNIEVHQTETHSNLQFSESRLSVRKVRHTYSGGALLPVMRSRFSIANESIGPAGAA